MKDQVAFLIENNYTSGPKVVKSIAVINTLMDRNVEDCNVSLEGLDQLPIDYLTSSFFNSLFLFTMNIFLDLRLYPTQAKELATLILDL